MDELLIAICIAMEDRVRRAARTGAWETWLQVELAMELESRGITVNRESRYQGSRETLDLDIQSDGERYAVEVKVESGSNPGHIETAQLQRRDSSVGSAVSTIMAKDISKVAQFAGGGARHFLLVVCYSPVGMDVLQSLANDAISAPYTQGSSIAVAVFDADKY